MLLILIIFLFPDNAIAWNKNLNTSSRLTWTIYSTINMQLKDTIKYLLITIIFRPLGSQRNMRHPHLASTGSRVGVISRAWETMHSMPPSMNLNNGNRKLNWLSAWFIKSRLQYKNSIPYFPLKINHISCQNTWTEKLIVTWVELEKWLYKS